MSINIAELLVNDLINVGSPQRTNSEGYLVTWGVAQEPSTGNPPWEIYLIDGSRAAIYLRNDSATWVAGEKVGLTRVARGSWKITGKTTGVAST